MVEFEDYNEHPFKAAIKATNGPTELQLTKRDNIRLKELLADLYHRHCAGDAMSKELEAAIISALT